MLDMDKDYWQGRPVRLSEATRLYAYESQMGKYGDEAVRNDAVSLDDYGDAFEALEDIDKYDAAIKRIAEAAPIRIVKGERLLGSASLGRAIHHVVPALYKGNPVCGSISHLTLGFEMVLKRGINELERDILCELDKLTAEQSDDIRGIRFLKSLLTVIEAMRLYHTRLMQTAEIEASKGVVDKETIANLRNVPFEKPTSFAEALQSIWFTFSFVRLCGNWPGIGRIDLMLGEYLQNDISSGLLNIEQARELLAHFFIKGCEWIQSDTPRGSGDAQHYQNIVLSGLDDYENVVANDVTKLVLDIVEELAISDFPITVRIGDRTPEWLIKRTAEVIRYGGGVVAVYNEKLILRSLESFGYSHEEALRFANDGCWEVQIPGKTYFTYVPFDALSVLLNTLGINVDASSYDSFEALYNDFARNLRAHVRAIYDGVRGSLTNGNTRTPQMPCSVVSLLTYDCIHKHRSYLEGGPVYTVISPHIGGAPDVGNCLYAIDELVFKQQKATYSDFIQALKDNWQGHEQLRLTAASLTYYGNDNDAADRYVVRVMNDFADAALEASKGSPIMFPPGASTFGRQIEWAAIRTATPMGTKKGDYLAANCSPTPGTDTEGATALIRSYCKISLDKQVTGAALDVKLYPGTVKGEQGVCAIKGLINGFVTLGGYFMQIDVADPDTLIDAQLHPEKYRNLSVRVSGWNARFITLNKEWQDMVINNMKREG